MNFTDPCSLNTMLFSDRMMASGPCELDSPVRDDDVLFQDVVRATGKGKRGIPIAHKQIVPQCVAAGHVVLGRTSHADAQVAYHQTVFRLLVQIIRRGPVASRIDNVVDEVTADHNALQEEM